MAAIVRIFFSSENGLHSLEIKGAGRTHNTHRYSGDVVMVVLLWVSRFEFQRMLKCYPLYCSSLFVVLFGPQSRFLRTVT